MNYELFKLKCEEDNRQTVQLLNMVELWLMVGMLTLEIMRKAAANAPNE